MITSASGSCSTSEVTSSARGGFRWRNSAGYAVSRRRAFYAWPKNSGGVEVSDVKQLRELEDENRRLKKLVAEQARARAGTTGLNRPIRR